MIQYDFSGKVVLVTGSSRGIGAATLEAFARAGAECVLHYYDDPEGKNRRDAMQLAQAMDAIGEAKKLHLLSCDVRDAEAVAKMMERICDILGGLDILVNNAGILKDRTLHKMSMDEWHDVIRTNLDGVFYCCKHALPILRDAGRIINIASIAAVAGFPGQSNYAAAKAGVVAMTKVLAKELAARKITVNAVAPGVIKTSMLSGIRPEVVSEYEKQIPLGRLGTPEDVANAVLFFATEESNYISGQVLTVSGGWY